MAVDTSRTAAYAPLSNVLLVIRRLRDRGLPDTLTPPELTRIGIPEGNAPRTLQALKFLGLSDEEGHRTSQFDRLGRATTSEYPEVLAEIVKAAYVAVFTIIDPSTAGEREIHDAFRSFEPRAQRDRMVSLFIGLCREAGLRPGGPVERAIRGNTKGRMMGVRRPMPARPTTVSKPAAEDGMVIYDLESDTDSASGAPSRPDYRLLLALIHQLPKDGKWSEARRDRWINAMTVNLDLLVEIDDGSDR